MNRCELLGQGLGRDFKAAQVGRQEQHALVGCIGLIDRFEVFPAYLDRRTQPETGKLCTHPACMRNRGPANTQPQARLSHIGHKSTAVGR